MKNILVLLIATILLACGGGSDGADGKSGKPDLRPKGIGEVKKVTLNDPLDQNMVNRGRAIYDMKCAACHKLSAKRVVGPGWAGLTDKRRPEWIMNMITNVEVMLDKDPVARKLLEECLTRMPNQNVSIGDARDILEFIYQNELDQKANEG